MDYSLQNHDGFFRQQRYERVDLRTGGEVTEVGHIDWLSGYDGSDPPIPRVDWVICGGESGPGARPCDVAWIRSIVEQCKSAGVPCFYKQGGRANRCAHDQKGGHIDCFPDDLKIREFPSAL